MSIKLYDELTPIPNPIAQTSKIIENIGEINNPEWVDFKFNSEVNLVINQTYYIGVVQENLGVHSTNGNTSRMIHIIMVMLG